jgi:hypothetical protein
VCFDFQNSEKGEGFLPLVRCSRCLACVSHPNALRLLMAVSFAPPLSFVFFLLGVPPSASRLPHAIHVEKPPLALPPRFRVFLPLP